MSFRKTYVTDPVIYHDMYEISNQTLCRTNSDGLHNKSCLDRTCLECGVQKVHLHPEELRTDDASPDVSWECFDYVNIKSKRGETKKLMLVKKVTKSNN